MSSHHSVMKMIMLTLTALSLSACAATKIDTGIFRQSTEDNARVIVEAWRREYNEERPKKSLGGLTPAAYGVAPLTRTDYCSVSGVKNESKKRGVSA